MLVLSRRSEQGHHKRRPRFSGVIDLVPAEMNRRSINAFGLNDDRGAGWNRDVHVILLPEWRRQVLLMAPEAYLIEEPLLSSDAFLRMGAR